MSYQRRLRSVIAEAAEQTMEQEAVDVVLSGVGLPGTDGLTGRGGIPRRPSC